MRQALVIFHQPGQNEDGNSLYASPLEHGFFLFFRVAFFCVCVCFSFFPPPFLRAQSGPSPPFGFINSTTNKALVLIKIPGMPDFAKLSGQSRTRSGKAWRAAAPAAAEGIRGDFGTFPPPLLQTDAYIFQGSFFGTHRFLLQELAGF